MVSYRQLYSSEFKDANAMNITLPPLYLHMHYTIVDSNKNEWISFPGKFLVEEITLHTRRAFHFDVNNPNGVFTTNKETLKAFMKGKIDNAPTVREDIEHMQPLLSVQDVTRILSGQINANTNAHQLPLLNTPSKWYYAARSAEKVHEAKVNQHKKFFLYQIAGHIIARRMIQTSMHYVSDLGSVSNYSIHSLATIQATTTPEIQCVLNTLLSQPNFENLDSKSILTALQRAKKSWQQKATQQRDEALSKEKVMQNNLCNGQMQLKKFSKIFVDFSKMISRIWN